MAVPLNDAEVTKISTRERQRIAHDLHDGLGQLLGGIALKLQALHEALAERAQPEISETADLIALVNEAIAQTRLLARGLDPVIPQTASLASALAKLATDTARLFRVSCTFSHITAPHDEAPMTAEHLFRVAQESINNAIRHGKATQILLELGADEREITLLIRDNGKGAARTGGDPVSGIGLRIMRHRAEAIGGTFEIKPGVDGGTVVHCRAPLRPPA